MVLNPLPVSQAPETAITDDEPVQGQGSGERFIIAGGPARGSFTVTSSLDSEGGSLLLSIPLASLQPDLKSQQTKSVLSSAVVNTILAQNPNAYLPRRTHVSEEEQKGYYLGFPGKPRLLGRTGPNWTATKERKYVGIVGNHRIANVWPQLLKKIMKYLDSENLRWNSLEANRVAYGDSRVCPVFVLIGVNDPSLRTEDACRIAERVKEFLFEMRIFDVEVELRERKIISASGQGKASVSVPPVVRTGTGDSNTLASGHAETGVGNTAPVHTGFSFHPELTNLPRRSDRRTAPTNNGGAGDVTEHNDGNSTRPLVASAHGAEPYAYPTEELFTAPAGADNYFRLWDRMMDSPSRPVAAANKPISRMTPSFSMVTGTCLGNLEGGFSTGSLFILQKLDNTTFKVFILGTRHGNVPLKFGDYDPYADTTNKPRDPNDNCPIYLFSREALAAHVPMIGALHDELEAAAFTQPLAPDLPPSAEQQAFADIVNKCQFIEQSWLDKTSSPCLWINNRIGKVANAPSRRMGNLTISKRPYLTDWCLIEVDDQCLPNEFEFSSTDGEGLSWNNFYNVIDINRLPPSSAAQSVPREALLSRLGWKGRDFFSPIRIAGYVPEENIFPRVQEHQFDADYDYGWTFIDNLVAVGFKRTVYKWGWKTGHTLGEVNNVAAVLRSMQVSPGHVEQTTHIALQIPPGSVGLGNIGHRNNAMFAEPGDSGAIIIDQHRRAVGTILACGLIEARDRDNQSVLDGYTYGVALWQTVEELRTSFSLAEGEFKLGMNALPDNEVERCSSQLL